MKVRRCRYCGEAIPTGKRLDARFCSDICRGRNHRGEPRETATNGFPGTSDRSRLCAIRLYVRPGDGDREILAKVRAARQRRAVG